MLAHLKNPDFLFFIFCTTILILPASSGRSRVMTELEANYKSCQLSKLFPREVKQNAASPATLNTTAEKVKVEEILNERLFLFFF